MSYFTGKSGSNAFRVKDKEAFLLALDGFEIQVDTDDKGRVLLSTDSTEGTWPNWKIEDEIEYELDLPVTISEHILPGDVAIIWSVGWQRSHPMSEIHAINSHFTKTISLDDIEFIAASMAVDPYTVSSYALPNHSLLDRPLTPEERYLAGGGAHCPSCGEDQIESNGIGNCEGNTYTQEVSCLICNSTWAETYRLTGIFNHFTNEDYQYAQKIEELLEDDRIKEVSSEMIHDLKSKEASSICNNSAGTQIDYLRTNSDSYEDLYKKLAAFKD